MDNTQQADTQAVEATPADTAPEATSATPTPADLAAKATPAQTEQPEQQAQTEQPETFDRAYVEKLRKEAAEYRTKAKTEAEKVTAEKQNLINELGKALGFVNDEEQSDPAKLIEQAAAERDKYRNELNQLRTENALTKAATTAKADTDLLIPFLRGTGALDALDPTADDYASQVEQLVTNAVNSNPKLKINQITASGVDTTNNKQNPAERTYTLADLDGMTNKEIYEAQKAGKLNHLFK